MKQMKTKILAFPISILAILLLSSCSKTPVFYDDFDDDSEPDFDYNDPDETNKRYDRRFPALYTL